MSVPTRRPSLAEEPTVVPVDSTDDESWRVLLYNDQVHSFTDVVALLVIATGFSLEKCHQITLSAHTMGRAEVARADQTRAEEIAAVLTGGGLLAAVRRV